eukprot:scaffold165850_cov30-Prasinocladus_malaysianus.AAC.1
MCPGSSTSAVATVSIIGQLCRYYEYEYSYSYGEVGPGGKPARQARTPTDGRGGPCAFHGAAGKLSPRPHLPQASSCLTAK